MHNHILVNTASKEMLPGIWATSGIDLNICLLISIFSKFTLPHIITIQYPSTLSV